jgi:hypothetical protein
MLRLPRLVAAILGILKIQVFLLARNGATGMADEKSAFR